MFRAKRNFGIKFFPKLFLDLFLKYNLTKIDIRNSDIIESVYYFQGKFFRNNFCFLSAYQRYNSILHHRVICIILCLCAGSAREIPAHMRMLGLISPMRFINPIAKFQSGHFGMITHSG